MNDNYRFSYGQKIERKYNKDNIDKNIIDVDRERNEYYFIEYSYIYLMKVIMTEGNASYIRYYFIDTFQPAPETYSYVLKLNGLYQYITNKNSVTFNLSEAMKFKDITSALDFKDKCEFDMSKYHTRFVWD